MYGFASDGRRTLETTGYFSDTSYLHGKGYKAPTGFNNIRDLSKSQMYPGYPKWKVGLQDCNFDQKFKRVFAQEGWTTPYQRQLREQMKAKEKNVTPISFYPSSYTKKQACPGDYFGTFGGTVKAFSPARRKCKEDDERGKVKVPPNVLTNPAKKGGPGYIDICLSKYPAYKGSPYDDPFFSGKREKVAGFLGGGKPDFFDKNPWRAKNTTTSTYRKIFTQRTTLYGPFAPPRLARKRGDRYYGGMSEYPEYKPDKRMSLKQKETTLSGPFYPQIRDKTKYTCSVMQRKLDLSVNSDNWKSAQAVTFTKEFY